jgi:hypothetical protein
MLLLAQAVPGPDTPCPERRICLDEVWPRPHDLCPCNLVIQPSEPPRPPPSQPGAVTKLGDYVMTVKGNMPTLYRQLKKLPWAHAQLREKSARP